MPQNNTIQFLAGEIAKVFMPLKSASSAKQVNRLFNELGYELPAGHSFDALSELAAPLTELEATLSSFINAGSVPAKWEAAQRLFPAIDKMVNAVQDSLSAVKISVTSVPGFITSSEIDELPRRLLDYLFTSYLKKNHKRFYSVALLLGIFDEVSLLADPTKFQPAFTLNKFLPGRISDYFTSPKDIPETVYSWRSEFKSALFINRLAAVFNAFYLPGGLYDQNERVAQFLQNTSFGLKELRTPVFTSAKLPDSYSEFGLVVSPVEKSASLPGGLALIPYFSGNTAFDFAVSNRFDIHFESSLSVDAGIALIVRPPAAVSISSTIFSVPADSGDASIKLELAEKTNANEWVIIGKNDGSRLSIKGVYLKTFAGTEDTGFEAGVKSISLVIQGNDSDGFVHWLTGGKEIRGEAGFSFVLSREQGLHFTGSGGFECSLPAYFSLGFLELQGIKLGILTEGAKPVVSAGANLKFNLGPVSGTVNNIGIKATLSFPENGGNLAVANLEFGFKAPDGAGLYIDAGGIKGGGTLNHDPIKKEYFGGMQLEFRNLCTLKAYGLISTLMPDGTKGFSLIIIITAEFSPIQLGYGFTLNGVGGLLGVNRTTNVDLLREGVKTGALQSILFPQNVVTEIDHIITDIRSVFPPLDRHYLLCPMGKIGWGTPTLITIDLGLLIEIPVTGFKILGVVKALLPSVDKPLLKLQVNFLGEIDFEKRSISFLASLYESRLLTFTMSGQMALRILFGDNPLFILTVGGFHPDFTEAPADLKNLERITISLYNSDDARISIQSYFAITSNTVQFGARAELYAQKGGFNIYGFVSYDVLFQLDPFHFSADIGASVALRRHDSVIMSVHVSGQLSGPGPWDAKGEAGVSFFFFSVSVPFHVTWGDRDSASSPQTADLQTLIIAEVNQNHNWIAGLPDNNSQHVTIKEIKDAGSSVVIHPFGILTFSQRLIPLEVDLTHVGTKVPQNMAHFKIRSAEDGPPDPVTELFAPGNFFDLTDEQKLSRPSFEKMTSGFRLSGSKELIAAEHIATKDVGYEFSYLDAPKKTPRKPYRYPGNFFKAGTKNGAISGSPVSAVSIKTSVNAPQPVLVESEKFVIAGVADLKAFEDATFFANYSQTEQVFQQLLQERPELAGQIQIVSNYELIEN